MSAAACLLACSKDVETNAPRLSWMPCQGSCLVGSSAPSHTKQSTHTTHNLVPHLQAPSRLSCLSGGSIRAGAGAGRARRMTVTASMIKDTNTGVQFAVAPKLWWACPYCLAACIQFTRITWPLTPHLPPPGHDPSPLTPHPTPHAGCREGETFRCLGCGTRNKKILFVNVQVRGVCRCAGRRAAGHGRGMVVGGR